MNVKERLKKNKAITIIFLISLIMNIAFMFSTPVKWWDETIYANLGYDLSKNLFQYTFLNKGWSDFMPDIGDSFYAWPKAGFRPPLLPYIISPFYLVKISYLIEYIIPLIGALTVVITYLIGKKIYDKRTAILASIFLMILPIHAEISGRILTDSLVTFFVIITFVCFWKGFEENNKKYKILFGFFLAIAVLSKYNALWIIPVFLLYLIIKEKSLKFLKDKTNWLAVTLFFLTISPWLLYSYFEYNNPIGFFIHAQKAAAFWGGAQPWYFYLTQGYNLFSIVSIAAIIALGYFLYKKEYKENPKLLIFLWIIIPLLFAILMPHKEGRHILMISPALALISASLVNHIKKYKNIFLLFILILLSLSLIINMKQSYNFGYTETQLCFKEALDFIEKRDIQSLIITDESPLVYFYTHQNTHFYPEILRKEIIKDYKKNEDEILILFSDFDMDIRDKKIENLKIYLDNEFEKIYECKNKTIIYRYTE